MGLWELISLEMDYSGETIGDYFENTLGRKIRRNKYVRKEVKQENKETVCNITRRAVAGGQDKKLVVYGCGYYHHYTYGLCKYADRLSEDYGYIHFDHHEDYWREDMKKDYLRGFSKPRLNKDRNRIDCGSFVADILYDTNASALLLVGSTLNRAVPKMLKDKPHESLSEKQFRNKTGMDMFKRRLDKLPEDVYLSFDLDVMEIKYIETAYSQGTLKPKELMAMIEAIKSSKNIISADVLAYGGLYNRTKPGRKLYREIVDSLMEA